MATSGTRICCIIFVLQVNATLSKKSIDQSMQCYWLLLSCRSYCLRIRQDKRCQIFSFSLFPSLSFPRFFFSQSYCTARGMKRFTSSSESPSPPVDLVVDSTPVHFVGPATQDNPMSHVRTKLMGKVVFHDRKIKWNRITLQLAGRAGLNISTSVTNLPRDVLMNMSDLNGGVTNLQTTVAVCDVEKELIFTGAPVIDFGIHLPSHLPPSIKAKHAFVEYTLVATFSAGSFFKKYKVQRNVTVQRHYLPNPSALIPSVGTTVSRTGSNGQLRCPKRRLSSAAKSCLRCDGVWKRNE